MKEIRTKDREQKGKSSKQTTEGVSMEQRKRLEGKKNRGREELYTNNRGVKQRIGKAP